MNKKNRVAHLVPLSKAFFILLGLSSLFSPSSLKASSCQKISLKDISLEFPKVSNSVKKIKDFWETGEASSLEDEFHPRLKISKDKLSSLHFFESMRLGSIKSILEQSWKVISTEQKPENLYCEADGIEILTHYGYPFQFNFWLKLVGEKEQGVLFFSMVPKEDRFYIGSFKVLKWTHLGINYKDWAKRAFETKNFESRYLNLDIAKKLTLGEPFFRLDAQAEISELQEKIWKDEKEFLAYFQKVLPDFALKRVATVFNSNGIGLKFSLVLSSHLTLRNKCQKLKKALSVQAIYPFLSGIRCEAVGVGKKNKKSSLYLSF